VTQSELAGVDRLEEARPEASAVELVQEKAAVRGTPTAAATSGAQEVMTLAVNLEPPPLLELLAIGGGMPEPEMSEVAHQLPSRVDAQALEGGAPESEMSASAPEPPSSWEMITSDASTPEAEVLPEENGGSMLLAMLAGPSDNEVAGQDANLKCLQVITRSVVDDALTSSMAVTPEAPLPPSVETPPQAVAAPESPPLHVLAPKASLPSLSTASHEVSPQEPVAAGVA